jgi:hypothetical protein
MLFKITGGKFKDFFYLENTQYDAIKKFFDEIININPWLGFNYIIIVTNNDESKKDIIDVYIKDKIYELIYRITNNKISLPLPQQTSEIRMINILKKEQYESQNNMLNYTYLFMTDNSFSQNINDDNILNIINEYSYPCILKHTLNNKDFKLKDFKIEMDLLYYYINNPSVLLIKIPRILYDLFNILFHLNNKGDFLSYSLQDYNNSDIGHQFCKQVSNEECEDIITHNGKIKTYFHNDYNTYNKQIYKIFNDCKNDIIKLNYFILNIINEVNHSITNINWHTIFKKIITKIQMFHDDKRFQIFSNLKQYASINLLSIRVINILEMTLKIELNKNNEIINNANDDKIILYRGMTYKKEGPVTSSHPFFSGKEVFFSLSYNTSILNAILTDPTACTLYYYKQGSINYESGKTQFSGFIKQYILLDKIYYNNHIVTELFFIPPIHPYILLIIGGEYWHARSKFPASISKSDNKDQIIRGIADGHTYKLDYLISHYDKDKLQEKFTEYLQNRKKIVARQIYQKYNKN